MKISYLDLLIKLSSGETPDLIKLELNCGERYYQAFYDNGEFNYYGLCDEDLEDEDFKYYLSDTLLESQMFEDNIEIIEEDKETVFIPIEEFNISYNLGFIDYRNIEVLKEYLNKDFQTIYDILDLLIKNQKKLINEVNKLKRR